MADTLPPTPDQLRERSELLAQKYPPPANVGDPDPLVTVGVLGDAIAQVGSLSGRIMDPANPQDAASSLVDTPEPVPAGLVPTALRAVTLMAEAIATMREVKRARQRAARLRVRGTSAGPWSEQYWDPAMVRGGTRGRPSFVDDPDLDDALWALATQDAQFQLIYLAGGQAPPGAAVSAFNFNRRAGVGLNRGVGPGGVLGISGDGLGTGPDGF